MLNYKYEGFLFASVWLATLYVCTEFAKKWLAQKYACSRVSSWFWHALTWQSHIKRLDYLFFTLSVERKLSKTLSRTSYLDRTITTTQIYRPLWYRTFTSGLAFSSQQKFLNNSQTIPAYLERKLWQHVLSGGLHSNHIVWKKWVLPIQRTTGPISSVRDTL